MYREVGDREWYGTSLRYQLLTVTQQALGPHNCQIQGYSESQISRETERPCGRLLMIWRPVIINMNMGVLGMHHCVKTKLSYPLPSTHTKIFKMRGSF